MIIDNTVLQIIKTLDGLIIEQYPFLEEVREESQNKKQKTISVEFNLIKFRDETFIESVRIKEDIYFLRVFENKDEIIFSRSPLTEQYLALIENREINDIVSINLSSYISDIINSVQTKKLTDA